MHTVIVSRQGEYLFERDIEINNTAIGRSQDAEIVLPHGTVSRRHALVYRAQDRLAVVDLGSSNGTYVNGERVEGERVLQHGDTIYCGIFSIELRPVRRRREPRQAQPEATHQIPRQKPPRRAPPKSDEMHVGKTLGPGAINLDDLYSEMERRRIEPALPRSADERLLDEVGSEDLTVKGPPPPRPSSPSAPPRRATAPREAPPSPASKWAIPAPQFDEVVGPSTSRGPSGDDS